MKNKNVKIFDNEEIKNFKVFNLLFIKKNFKNWTFIIFSLILPILFMVVFFFAFGKNSDKDTQVTNTLGFIPDSILLSSILIGSMSVPSLFGIDRISNKNKMFAVMGIKKSTYFTSLYTSVLMLFFVLINIQLLILDYGFVYGELGPSKYFQLLFINVFIFTAFFVISMYVASFGQNSNRLFLAINIFFLSNLFFSGAVLPTIVIDKNSIIPSVENSGELSTSFFKWIQYLTPAGCGVRMSQMVSFGNNFTDWNTDWIAILSPILQGTVAFILFNKKFKWVS